MLVNISHLVECYNMADTLITVKKHSKRVLILVIIIYCSSFFHTCIDAYLYKGDIFADMLELHCYT